MHRLSEQRGTDWQPATGTGTFSRESTGRSERLAVSPANRPMQLLMELAPTAGEQFYLLWVLHTPRGGSKSGRYQSPLLPVLEVNAILTKFADFLERDGRHDLWLHAPATGATLVWDRHEKIFLYGPLAEFESRLTASGLSRGEMSLAAPHAHHYHEEFDEAERSLAEALDWKVSELREEDEQ